MEYEQDRRRAVVPTRQPEAPQKVEEPQSNAAMAQAIDEARVESDTPILDTIAPEQAPTPLETVASGTTRLEQLRAGVEAGEEGAEEAYQAALTEESSTFAAALTAQSPEEVSAFLAQGGAQAAHDMLSAALQTNDQTTMQGVVEALMQGGESLSREDAATLGQALAAVDTGPDSPLRQVIAQGIRNGNGALLAMTMAESLSGRDREAMLYSIDGAIYDVQDRFETDQAAATAAQLQMLAVEAELMERGATEEEVQRWREGELAANAEVLAAQEASAATFASTLEGQSYALDNRDKRRISPSTAVYQRSMAMAGDLASTNAGAEAAAQALLRSGQGEGSWIETAGQRLDEEAAGKLDRLITQGASQGMGALAAAGDLGSMDTFLIGLGNVIGEEQAPGIEAMRERVAALASDDIAPQDLPLALAGAIRGDGDDAVAEHLIDRMALGVFLGGHVNLADGVGLAGAVSGTAGNVLDWRGGNRGRGLGVMGAALSLFSNGVNAFDEGNWTDIGKAGMDAAVLGAHGAELLGSSRLMGVVSKAALPVAALFSTLEVLSHLQDRNFKKAAVASLPLVGMGIGSILGPGGAAVGAGIGAILSGVLKLLGVGASDQITGIATEALTEILSQRGISPGAAAQLAGELATPGVVERLRFMATDLGYADEAALLEALGTGDPEYMYFFFLNLNRFLNFEDDAQGQRQRVEYHTMDGDPYLYHLDIVSKVRPEDTGPNWADDVQNVIEERRGW